MCPVEIRNPNRNSNKSIWRNWSNHQMLGLCRRCLQVATHSPNAQKAIDQPGVNWQHVRSNFCLSALVAGSHKYSRSRVQYAKRKETFDWQLSEQGKESLQLSPRPWNPHLGGVPVVRIRREVGFRRVRDFHIYIQRSGNGCLSDHYQSKVVRYLGMRRGDVLTTTERTLNVSH